MARISRKEFLKRVAFAGAGVGLAGCTPAPPAPTEKIVEKQVPVTQVVEKQVQVTQVVEQTRVVEKVVTSTPGPAGPRMAENQTLLLQQDAEPSQGLDPAWVVGWGRMQTLCEALYSGMVYQVPNTLEIKGDIAKSWEVSPDFKVWTFHMRDDVKFNDGSPVTAEDFAWTWRRALTPMSAEQMLDAGVIAPTSDMARYLFDDLVGALPFIKGESKTLPDQAIVVKDKYTLQVTLESGRPDFIARLSHPGTAVLKKANVETSKKGAVWYEKPVGTGPFMLESWKHNQQMVLVPNPHYYGEKPKLTRITMPIVADPQTVLVLYDNAELEVAKPELGDAAQFVKANHRLFPELKQQSEFIEAILKLFPHPPLDDVNVRKALELSIDKELICQSLLGGALKPADTFMDPSFSGYDMTGVKFNKYDPNLAREALAASKYGKDVKAMPAIKVLVPGGLAARAGIAPGTWQGIAAAIQEMWVKNLGIKVEIKVKELESETLDTMHHVTFTRWGAFYSDPLGRVDRWVQDVLSLEALTIKNPVYKPIDAPGLVDLRKQAQAEADAKKRWTHFQKFEQLRVDYVPYIPLYYNRTFVLMKPWVKNFTLGHIWDFPFLNKVYIEPH